MIYKDISEQIEELRCKLHKELEKSGFDTKKALKISEELDELIENFYVEKNMKKTNDNNSLYKEYMIAYNRLKELLKKNGLEAGADIKEILSDKQLEEYIKEDFDLLIEGACSRSDSAYKNLADEVEKVYKKLIKE